MLRAVAILALVVTTTSQPPAPAPTETSHRADRSTTDGGAKSAGKSNSTNPFVGSHAFGGKTSSPDRKGSADSDGASSQWWFNFLLVIFTGALAVVSVFQLRAMSGQLASMKTTGDDTHTLADAAREQLAAIVDITRARLAVKTLSHLPIAELHHPNLINASIINCGLTPAIGAKSFGLSATTNRGEPIDWDTLDIEKSQEFGAVESVAIIGASQDVILPIELFAFSGEEIAAVREGSLELHLYGTTQYLDVFQPLSHTLEFTAYYSPTRERWFVGKQTEK